MKAICKKNFKRDIFIWDVVKFGVGSVYKTYVVDNGITVFEDNEHYYTFYNDNMGKFKFSEYFYTEQEIRKLKLKRLNVVR